MKDTVTFKISADPYETGTEDIDFGYSGDRKYLFFVLLGGEAMRAGPPKENHQNTHQNTKATSDLKKYD